MSYKDYEMKISDLQDNISEMQARYSKVLKERDILLRAIYFYADETTDIIAVKARQALDKINGG